jgi:hypothetical protein
MGPYNEYRDWLLARRKALELVSLLERMAQSSSAMHQYLFDENLTAVQQLTLERVLGLPIPGDPLLSRT